MVVTAKSRNEKMNKKKLAQEDQLFLLWKNRTPPPPPSSTTITTTTITITTPLTVRKTIVLPKTNVKFNYAAIKEEKVPVPKKALLRQNTSLEKYP